MNYEEIRGKCDEIIRLRIISGDFKLKVNVIIRDKIMEYIHFPVSNIVNNLLFDITYSNSYKDIFKRSLLDGGIRIDKEDLTERILNEL